MGKAADSLRIGLALDFIGALDLVAIRLWRKRLLLGSWATVDQPSCINDERKWCPINFETFWLRPSHAQLVHSQCQIPSNHDEGADIEPDIIRDQIVNTAALLGAPFRSTDDLFAIAMSAVDEILAHVETQRLNGGLAQVNAGYKIYRQQQTAKNEKAVPYSAHLHAFTRSIVTEAAKVAHVI
jgi:hypothetical protein